MEIRLNLNFAYDVCHCVGGCRDRPSSGIHVCGATMRSKVGRSYSARVDHQIVVARSVHPCVARTIDVKKSAVNRDMWEQGANRKVLPP
jgi:hypothetical protein